MEEKTHRVSIFTVVEPPTTCFTEDDFEESSLFSSKMLTLVIQLEYFLFRDKTLSSLDQNQGRHGTYLSPFSEERYRNQRCLRVSVIVWSSPNRLKKTFQVHH